MQKRVLDDLRLGFGDGQMMCGVRIDVSVAEAFAVNQPLRRYRINSRAAEDFRAVADDVTRRFNLPARAQAGDANSPAACTDHVAGLLAGRQARV